MVTQGIYQIENSINGKRYIGSSFNIPDRWKRHIRELNKGTHKNKHLLAAWNKYGCDNFKFSILELCTPEEINKKEEYYISKYPFEELYNKTKLSVGGSDVVSIPCLLLDLNGKVLSEWKSLSELARCINKGKQIQPHLLNTGKICCKKYRVVTYEFFNSISDIKKWSIDENRTKFKIVEAEWFYIEMIKDGKYFYFKTYVETGKHLNLSTERVRQILNSKKNIVDNYHVIKKRDILLKIISNK